MLGSVCCVLAIAIAAGQNQGTIENDNGSLRFVVAPGKVRVQIHPRLACVQHAEVWLSLCVRHAPFLLRNVLAGV